MSECRHGEPRGEWSCALCRWDRRYGTRPLSPWRVRPSERDRPMPAWFRTMVKAWRDSGTLTLPEHVRTAWKAHDDDGPRYS